MGIGRLKIFIGTRVRVNIEDKYSVFPAGSSMAEFSEKQMQQLKEHFGTPLNLLSQVYGELSQQIGVLSQSSDHMS